jgi:hypothetical protein
MQITQVKLQPTQCMLIATILGAATLAALLVAALAGAAGLAYVAIAAVGFNAVAGLMTLACR